LHFHLKTPLILSISILLRSWLFVKVIFGISEKVQKFLITHLPAGRQGLNSDYTDDSLLDEYL